MDLHRIAQKVVADQKKKEQEGAQKASASEMVDLMKQMAAELQALKSANPTSGQADKLNQSRKEDLLLAITESSKEHKQKVLRSFERMSFTSDDDFNQFLEDEKAYVQTLQQQESNSKLGKDFPKPGIPGNSGVASIDDPVLDEVMKNIRI
ncbi:hypothetical protein H8S90_21280 [Olivibacter sp. SDN3]|uniref:hypothetical protein n=1 Tax=Olivibacter sp. SDN3 TaxID=2764720 RepID=UPI001650FEC3|nr:hypothetical protein [Olivibacter sp. SDN3]QNL49245.1 hypothetical protein H8S90_21280 [Olivibacter sp. SDN3]